MIVAKLIRDIQTEWHGRYDSILMPKEEQVIILEVVYDKAIVRHYDDKRSLKLGRIGFSEFIVPLSDLEIVKGYPTWVTYYFIRHTLLKRRGNSKNIVNKWVALNDIYKYLIKSKLINSSSEFTHILSVLTGAMNVQLAYSPDLTWHRVNLATIKNPASIIVRKYTDRYCVRFSRSRSRFSLARDWQDAKPSTWLNFTVDRVDGIYIVKYKNIIGKHVSLYKAILDFDINYIDSIYLKGMNDELLHENEQGTTLYQL